MVALLMSDTTTLWAIYDGFVTVGKSCGLRYSVQPLTPKETPATSKERQFSVLFPRGRQRAADSRSNPESKTYRRELIEVTLVHLVNPDDQEITLRKAFEDEQNFFLKIMQDHGEPLCSVDILEEPDVTRVTHPAGEWRFTTMKFAVAYWFDLTQDVVIENAR